MVNDFASLSAAIDAVATEIAEAVALLQNPVVDNNDQATIDALTARLSAAADALKGALPAEAPAAPVDTPPAA